MSFLVQIKFITEDSEQTHIQILILIKTILIGKYIQQMRRKLPSVAWLGKIETDSILIREKHKHLSKTSDRVSKMFEAQALKD